MNSHIIIEAVGYIGSAIVLVSFLMTSVFKLRVVNTIGSVIFMTYALIIHSYPTAIMNLCLALINIRFLWKMRHTSKEYELVDVHKDDLYLQYLLEKNESDINNCFPGIDLHKDQDPLTIDTCYLITCQGAPAGIVLGLTEDRTGQDGEKTLSLVLDYAIPEYTDFSIGEFMSVKLKERGFTKLTYSGPTANHMAYLKRLEYKEHNGTYEKVL